MRIVTRAAAVLAAMAAAAVPLTGLAGPAGAAVGPRASSAGQAGISVTGGQFRDVRGRLFARNGAAVSATNETMGGSVSLWTGTAAHGTIIVLGWGTGTGAPHEPWQPTVAVYVDHSLVANQGDAAVNGQTCSGSICTPGDGAVVPDQQPLRLELFYDRGPGNVVFTATALTSGVTYKGFYHVGTGLSFSQARLAGDFGNTPFDSAHYTFSPVVATPYVTFTRAGLTSYSGHRAGLISWWTRHHLDLTDAVGGAHAGSLFAHGTGFPVLVTP